jgi:hypothetical protein
LRRFRPPLLTSCVHRATVLSRSLYIPSMCAGKTHLAAHMGSGAAGEFQKILDHRGVVFNEPIGAFARLGLARAYELQGDTTSLIFVEAIRWAAKGLSAESASAGPGREIHAPLDWPTLARADGHDP